MSLQKQTSSFVESTLKNVIETATSILSNLQDLVKINEQPGGTTLNKNHDLDLLVQCKTALPLVQSFEKKMRYVQIDNFNIPHEVTKNFDLKITTLWNLSVTVSKLAPLPVSSLALCQVKHLASLLLVIQQSLFPSISNILRTLKCLIKTESAFIEGQNYNDMESLFDLNDTCIKRIESFQAKISLNEQTVLDVLKIESFFVQIIMSLKLENFETAKSIFRFSDIKKYVNGFKYLGFLDYLIQLFNCCVDLMSLSKYHEVVDWITIILDMSTLMTPKSTEENKHLNVLLRNANRLLIRALCTYEPSKAASIVKDMEIKFPDSTETFLSKFEVLDALKASSEQYENALMEFALSSDVSTNIENVMFLFQHLNSKCNVFTSFDYIIANKLKFEEENNMLLKILVARVQLTIDSKMFECMDLVEYFSLLERKFEYDPPRSFIETIMVMIWKKSCSLENEDYNKSAQCLELLNHSFFEEMISAPNIAKIERRLMFLYDKSGSWSKILEKEKKMRESDRKDVKTILHKVSYYLQADDLKNASLSIDQLCESNDEQMATVLALCISKARDLNKHTITLYSMKKMIDVIAQDKPIDKESINLPALIRSTIQLQLKSLSQFIKEFSNKRQEDKEILDDIYQNISATLLLISSVISQTAHFCSIIATEKKLQSEESSGNRFQFTQNDILWVASKSYFSAVQAIKFEKYEISSSLINFALELLHVEIDNEYVDYDGNEEKQRLIGICMVLLISASRKIALRMKQERKTEKENEELEESEKILWKKINELTQKGQTIWKSLASINETYLEDYVQKLVVYELDSCLHLHEWDQIKPVIQKMTMLCNSTCNSKRSQNKNEEEREAATKQGSFFWQCFVDLLLNCRDLPLDNLVESLRMIVTENFGAISNERVVESPGRDKNSEIEAGTKWTRILVGLTLPGREDTCIDVLTHFKEFLRGQGKIGIPGQDIQWIGKKGDIIMELKQNLA